MPGPLRIATWNVNGIRARQAQFAEWAGRERPDVICLQEIKASPAQVPEPILKLDGYHSYWHGAGGYSGVALLVSTARYAEPPRFYHPDFDHECRVVAAEAGDLTLASVYVPNGGKDYPAKLAFLDALPAWVSSVHARGSHLVVCGDLNVARTDRDVHEKERKPGVIGQRPEERERIERILGAELVNVARALEPERDDLFTWWAPWRNMKQRNIGWRIDYVLASRGLAAHARACAVGREVGTSDHAPVLATFDV